MKILDKEEREAHKLHLVDEGFRGFVYGSIISSASYLYLKYRHPLKFRSFNASIKTCIVTMPTIALCAFWADQGTVQFNNAMYKYGRREEIMNRYRQWQAKSAWEKCCTFVKGNLVPSTLATFFLTTIGSYLILRSAYSPKQALTLRRLQFSSVASAGALSSLFFFSFRKKDGLTLASDL